MSEKSAKKASGTAQRKSLPSRGTSPSRRKKQHLKRIVCISVLTLIVLAALCLALSAIYGALVKARTESTPDIPAAPNLDGKSYINFYEPDYSADIFKDADYLAENRTIRYMVSDDSRSVSIVLDEYADDVLNEGQRFFKRYFSVLTGGDYETYHTLFTEEYTAEPTGFETHPADRKFPMQRVYDITVTELGRSDPANTDYTYHGQPAVFGVYEVSYKILKNDGELRHDLPENGEVPLIFELVTLGCGTENEQTLIRDLYRYADIAQR